MSADTKPDPCYRDRDNGVYFKRQRHRPDGCLNDCRGCEKCHERHCSARKSCTWHVAEGELTCGRCIASARRDLRWLTPLASLMPTAAEAEGVASEAANLAGPVARYDTFSARRRIAKRWIEAHLPAHRWEDALVLLDDDDEHHPASVVTRWHMMLAEDYDHALPERLTLAGSSGYLDRNLHRIAHDDEQDFPLLARELRKTRQHLESVLHNDSRPERGAPCYVCADAGVRPAPRLKLERGHWCTDEECQKMHYSVRFDSDTEQVVPDLDGDMWVCPRNPSEHKWTEVQYRGWVEERVQSA